MLALVVKVHEPQEAQAAFRQCLVVEQHLGHGALWVAVAVVVEAVHARVGVVVVAAHDRADVGVRGDDFVVDPLWDRAEAAGGEHVFVEVDDRGAFRVCLEHFVHPFDLGIAWGPAHVEHDEVVPAGGDEVVVASVVLVGAAVPRVVGVAVFAEVLRVFGEVVAHVAHVVVAGEHTVWEAGFVEHLVCLVGVFPLELLLGLVDDVTGVEEVLQVECFAAFQKVVVDCDLVVVEGLVVVLGVGFPCEREVVLVAWGVFWVVWLYGAVASGEVRSGPAFGVLHDCADFAVYCVLAERHHRFECGFAGFFVGECHIDFLVGVGLGVPYE